MISLRSLLLRNRSSSGGTTFESYTLPSTNEFTPEEIAALRAALAGQATAPVSKGITFDELWTHFRRNGRVAQSTLATYESLWRIHVRPRFGSMSAMDVTPGEIMEFRAELREGGYPPSSRNRSVNVIRSLIKHGCKLRLMPLNPIPECDKEDEDNVREVVVTEGTIERVLDYLDCEYYVRYGEHANLLGVFFLVCVESGLRRLEATRIRWADVDFDAGQLYVSWTSAKLKRGRHTPLMSRTVEWMRRIGRVGEWVFTNPDSGSHYRPNHWETEWAGIRRSLALGDVTIHDLRRSFVTLARRRGVPETVVMKFSGHRSHDVFRRYAIVGPEDFETARAMLERGRLRELSAIAAAKRKRPTPKK